jgi:hypothetical protein
VNTDGVKMKEDIEVIEIMDNYDPYPTLLGIYWAFYNNVVLNMKKRHMLFKTSTLYMNTPLDTNEWDIHNDMVYEDAWISVIENIYNI